MRKSFSFCAASSCIKTLLLKSPLMIFMRTLATLNQGPSKFVCNFAPVIVYQDLRSTRDFADSISLTHTIASIGRLAHEDRFAPQIHSPDSEISDIRPGSEFKFLSLVSGWELCVCLSPCIRTVCGCPRYPEL